ncbi:WD40 repeat-like protein [Dendrothele bispora CBS 962.96]|uniref:WD40 repeat-like protein n=1 Tax=Dendrothele bispora (strain CBS 962.96) TaxID=1314807 RepID=A0A4S8LSC8_DENBC|nr:WD40 repeat-like protein [Dendrothele bispora CBS 962.96]
MPSFDFTAWRRGPYKLLTTLHGPRDTVFSVSISVEGRFVVATGYSGVYTWDLSTRAPVRTPFIPHSSNEPKNMFSALAWLLFEQGNRDVVVLGNMSGQIFLWEWGHQTQAFDRFCDVPETDSREQISSIGVLEQRITEPNNLQNNTGVTAARIAVAHVDGRVTVWLVSSDRSVTKIFGVIVPDIPKNVRFSQKSMQVLVFAMAGGNLYKLNPETGEVVEVLNCGGIAKVMGHVSLDETNDCFVAWTGRDFDIFALSDGRHLRTLDGGNPLVSFVKQVAFTNEGNLAISGTDRGCGILYDTRSGKAVQTLRYPKGGLVQPVTVSFSKHPPQQQTVGLNSSPLVSRCT